MYVIAAVIQYLTLILENANTVIFTILLERVELILVINNIVFYKSRFQYVHMNLYQVSDSGSIHIMVTCNKETL